jgi:Lamin Tail Domain
MRPLTPTSPVLRATLLPLSAALFLAACATAADNSDGGATPGSDASLDGAHFALPDSGATNDTGNVLPGSPDASPDTSVAHPDAAPLDSGTLDATVMDGSAGDAGPDATAHDAGGVDASVPDAHSADAAAHDAATKDVGAPDVHVPDGGCAIGHLVLSQVLSRGAGGANDEFIEIYNPTSAAVTLDTTWIVQARSTSASSYTTRWTGSSKSIPALGHYLLGGTSYTAMPAADAPLSSGITDATSVRLMHSGTTVDAVCYAYSASTKAAFDSTYTCAGTPATNPHNDTASTDTDSSLERAPGGTAGNCTDTGVSATDFATKTPSDPHSSTSAPTP